jgi:hypothetical protein
MEMGSSALPPILQQLYERARDIQEPHGTRALALELELVSRALQLPDSRKTLQKELEQIHIHHSPLTFTGSGGAVCMCCKRPWGQT